METNEFREQIKKLRGILDPGDYSRIARKAGVALNTLRYALDKGSVFEMGGKERKAYNTFLEYVSQKAAQLKEMELKAGEVASKL